ncbi:MAG: ABC transporter permease [Deltaproteobacteria bacterium]|nr:ABC transporter permease [Deltaproteobacteria bacterium]
MSAHGAPVRTVVAGERGSGRAAPLAMARAVWSARTVVRALVVRDLRGRYVGSALGTFWSIAQPLLQLATYTFVFATVMQVRVTDAGGGDVPFVLYLACGLFPWLAIQEAITRSATCLVDNPTLVKRVIFPVEVLPVQLACAAVVHQVIATALLLLLMAALGFPPRPTLAVWPLLLAAELAVAVGLGWAAATLHVFFRDTAQALGVLLPVWFYLTPILYPQHLVPPFLRPVLALNPMTALVRAHRDVVLYGIAPNGAEVLQIATASLATFAIGAWIFARARGEFADLV